MKEVLFVCEGNIGRSQMAEGFYNHFKNSNLATSAGITDVGEKYNYTPRKDIVLAMEEKGIDISGQRVKQITAQMVDEAEKVVVLCDSKLLPAFNRTDIIFRLVQDPLESSMDGVREVRDSIEKIVQELVDTGE